MNASTFVILVVFVSHAMCVKEETSVFNVQPNSRQSHHEISLGKVKCVFSWAAVGGTNEDWQITLTKQDGYVCVIERPDKASYLFFKNFAASVIGADFNSAEVFDSMGHLINEEDFTANTGQGSVQSVEGKFKNSLGRLILRATKHKRKKEL
ncbi:myeloid-derived growth factor homolog [Corticium candelabrum]|uniref:myeloid-derived growth factor homolog n=1 Tax=Corticium candelabrum TaxID=121492 RepID=UPI002E25F73F|nr:myeloid-derived growth factor homolog [Corticium candelabrum]